jgi:DNA-binding response OmpR family regulator
VLDLNLPKKPGREVLARMRSSLKCGQVPVVIFTSSDGKTDRDDATRYGASQYIQKPSALDDFIRIGGVIRDILYPAS